MTVQQNNSSRSVKTDLARYTMSVAVTMTGVSAIKIRRLETFGLCKPERTDGRQRLFCDEDIRTIHKIVSLEKEGVNLPGIKIILAMQKALHTRERRGKI